MFSWDLNIIIVSVAAIVAFMIAFRYSGLVSRARSVTSIASRAVDVISQKNMEDDEKGLLIQRAALDLLRQFVVISLISAALLAIPLAVMWLCDLTGIAPFGRVSDFLLGWEVVIGATVVAFIALWILKRR